MQCENINWQRKAQVYVYHSHQSWFITVFQEFSLIFMLTIIIFYSYHYSKHTLTVYVSAALSPAIGPATFYITYGCAGMLNALVVEGV